MREVFPEVTALDSPVLCPDCGPWGIRAPSPVPLGDQAGEARNCVSADLLPGAQALLPPGRAAVLVERKQSEPLLHLLDLSHIPCPNFLLLLHLFPPSSLLSILGCRVSLPGSSGSGQVQAWEGSFQVADCLVLSARVDAWPKNR